MLESNAIIISIDDAKKICEALKLSWSREKATKYIEMDYMDAITALVDDIREYELYYEEDDDYEEQ